MPLNVIDSVKIVYPLIVNSWNPLNGKLSATIHEVVNNNSYSIDYPLPIIQETETFTDYQVFLFKNRFGSKENQYFRLKIEETRIGIIFPIKVYSDPTNLPDQSDDEALYRFLFIAFHHLLHENNIISIQIDLDYLNGIGRPLKIEDFYDDETVVLLYYDSHNPTLVYDIKKIFPSLFKFGYVPICSLSDYQEIELIVVPITDTPLFTYSVQEWLKLLPVKSNLLDEPYIFQLFDSTLKTHLTSLVRFILLYQVIELLINRIGLEFYITNDPNTTDLQKLFIDNITLNSFRDLIDNTEKIKNKIDLSMIRKEETRIHTLIDGRCKLNKPDYPKLESAAVAIISTLTGTSITDFLYPIRNKIIHSYHSLAIAHPNMDELLTEYNREFELLVASIIINFL